MFQAMIMIAASLVAFAQADTCNLPTCPDGETCYSGSPEAIACMNSMPFNKEWATREFRFPGLDAQFWTSVPYSG